jgi:hypothetical protein
VCSVAAAVWVSLLSESLNFSVPDKRCSAPEFVVLVFSLKLPLAADDVKTGLWFVMVRTTP